MATALTLSARDKKTFRQLEDRITKGLTNFRETGSALMTIQEKGWFQLTHKTFDLYIYDKWGLSRSRAYAIIDAAKVGEKAFAVLESSQLDVAPLQAEHCKELKGLDENKIADVLTEAVKLTGENGTAKLTTKVIKTAREKVAPKPKRAAKPKPKEYEKLCSLGQKLFDDGNLTEQQMKDIVLLSKRDQKPICQKIADKLDTPSGTEINPRARIQEIARKYVAPMCREIEALSKDLGGKGKYHKMFVAAMNEVKKAFDGLGEGKK